MEIVAFPGSSKESLFRKKLKNQKQIWRKEDGFCVIWDKFLSFRPFFCFPKKSEFENYICDWEKRRKTISRNKKDVRRTKLDLIDLKCLAHAEPCPANPLCFHDKSLEMHKFRQSNPPHKCFIVSMKTSAWQNWFPGVHNVNKSFCCWAEKVHCLCSGL